MKTKEKLKTFCDFKKYKIQILIISLSLLFILISHIFFKEESLIIDGNKIKKQDYQGEDFTLNLYVDGLFDKKELIEIPVSKKVYSNAQIDDIFEACMEILPQKILAKNKDENEIRSKLNFINYIPEYGIDVAISPIDTDLIDSSGNILNDDLKYPKDAYLNVRLANEGRSADFSLQLRILPADKSEKGYILRSFLKSVDKENKRQANKDYLSLPTKWNNKKITYSLKANYNYIYILLFALIFSILLKINEKYKIKQNLKQTDAESLMEYPEIISKFIVYIEAGLSIRNIWEKIVLDYEKKLSYTNKKIYVYEEMKKACLYLKAGTHEAIVYKRFSRNMRLRQYTKFVSILEQNRKAGLCNIRDLLSLEAKTAWEERIQMAKRQGQQASTKLLLPLFIMLIIVILIVIVPAVLNIY